MNPTLKQAAKTLTSRPVNPAVTSHTVNRPVNWTVYSAVNSAAYSAVDMAVWRPVDGVVWGPVNWAVREAVITALDP